MTDEEFASAAGMFQPPLSKEAFLYRSLFIELFSPPRFDSIEEAERAVQTEPMTVACSTAVALEWDKSWNTSTDPSGRAVVTHADSSANDC